MSIDPSAAARPSPLLASDLMGGFECAAQKRRDGVRLDVLATTGHDRRAGEDYRLLRRHGMAACRDGMRWHRIEARPRRYDWSEVVPMLQAAEAGGIQVIWDLCHYGVPNGLDVFSPAFVERFAAYAGAAAQLVRNESSARICFTPINEMSFWAWAGGDTGGLNPFARGRGGELKMQLVRASLAAIAAIRDVAPDALIASAEPLIHILPGSDRPDDVARVAAHNEGQFEALDMLLGRRAPELGGSESAIDLIGINYYYNNQWVDGQRTVYAGDWLYRPLADLLMAVAARYDQPLYIAETGTEGHFRPFWLHMVCEDVREARQRGADVQAVCLYPVLSHLGWDDDRHCSNGLFDAHDSAAERLAYAPLAAEVARQVAVFAAQTNGQGHAA